MGDTYSFGDVEIYSELLVEIFKQHPDLEELIMDEETHLIYSNFDGNDTLDYPGNPGEMVKSLDDLIDILFFKEPFFENGLVEELFSNYEEDSPEIKTILKSIKSQREAVKASITSASLSYGITGLYPDDDSAGLLLQNFGTNEEWIEGIYDFNVTLKYEYQDGLSKWSFEGRFSADEEDDPIEESHYEEKRENINKEAYTPKPKVPKIKASQSNPLSLLETFEEKYQDYTFDEIVNRAIEVGEEIADKMKKYAELYDQDLTLIFGGLTSFPMLIDDELDPKEMKLIETLHDAFDIASYPQEFLEEINQHDAKESIIDQMYQLTDQLIKMTVLKLEAVIEYLVLLAVVDGSITEREKTMILQLLERN